ncbi:hypothetical protein EHQ12_15785 [Leptospira gomenensis]|uniref:Uncharacterized protein n=1 Tax=Leptospira gomenensis TaxID=2484974 RepID=A0A5F1YDI4_9LEPT|nr:hypothetical protein EHQ12_15785 [Leptospira gomenensis]TGK35262.1 hypothetical protein EHQ17_07440 [Leptospira gomenensis]TGK51747.1 hypothetical protein EHQ07_01940 [Leptospira gomenensis]
MSHIKMHTRFCAITLIKTSPHLLPKKRLVFRATSHRNEKKKKPEDSFEEYSGFRVVRRFITGIINPF